MPRFFYGNFHFEHQLADPGVEPSANLKRLNAELATSWLAIAEDGDFVWTPVPIEPNFFRDAAHQGLPDVIPVHQLSEVPRGIEFVPWGWSAEVRKLATRFQWKIDAPSEAAVRLANSRLTSEELERTWNVGLADAIKIKTLEELNRALGSPRHSHGRWVIKAEFSMSARERILGSGPATDATVNWVRRRLASQSAVFLEPWVERLDEIGIQIEVPQSGSPRLIGITPMLVDARGQYAGSDFSRGASASPSDPVDWTKAIEVALNAASSLQSREYFGPLGIDAMAYLDAERSLQIRPLQDINARLTMGRLSLGFRRLLNPGERGIWTHQAGDATKGLPFNVTRLIRTSPNEVGTEPCRHMSSIAIGRAIS